MTVAPGARDILAAVLSIAALVSGCSVAATPSPPATSMPTSSSTSSPATPAPSAAIEPPVTPAAVTAEVDGLTLTVVADRTTVGPGQVVTFTATFRNGTTAPIDYAPAACPGAAAGAVFVSQPTGPVGKTWPGIRGEFKDYALTESLGPGGVPALDPLRSEMRTKACGEQIYDPVTLPPGESVTNTLTWRPEIVAGVDAVAGTVPFELSAGYTAHVVQASPTPRPNGPLPSVNQLFRQIQVKGDLAVTGGDQHLSSPGEVVDALLADKAFAKWLAKEPKGTWSGTNLFLTSSPKGEGIIPKGPSWEIDLFREVNVPRQWAIAFVDPFDATVRSVTYCNVPCLR